MAIWGNFELTNTNRYFFSMFIKAKYSESFSRGQEQIKAPKRCVISSGQIYFYRLGKIIQQYGKLLKQLKR